MFGVPWKEDPKLTSLTSQRSLTKIAWYSSTVILLLQPQGIAKLLSCRLKEVAWLIDYSGNNLTATHAAVLC